MTLSVAGNTHSNIVIAERILIVPHVRGIVPVWPCEVDLVVDSDLGGVGLGEVDEGDVAEELLGCNLGVLLALDQSPYLLLEVWQANW